jgi:hypothetical protein
MGESAASARAPAFRLRRTPDFRPARGGPRRPRTTETDTPDGCCARRAFLPHPPTKISQLIAQALDTSHHLFLLPNDKSKEVL